MDQDALGNVVPVMAGGDSFEIAVFPEVFQYAVAKLPPGSFASGAQRWARVDPEEMKWNRMLRAEQFAKGRMIIRFFTADAMMDVGRFELE